MVSGGGVGIVRDYGAHYSGGAHSIPVVAVNSLLSDYMVTIGKD